MSPRPVVEDELRRVLALVPWLVAHPGARKDDVAARFGISRERLERDLALILMIGVPPYSPGDYIGVDADGETVEVWLAPYFRRPLRLTPAEALVLLAAGRALLAVPGSDPDGPLGRAVEKLGTATGGAEVDVSLGRPRFLADVREAAAAGETVEIDYWSAARGEAGTRLIEPGPPFSVMGEWYTDAHCHLRGEPRVFRIDRIQGLRGTGRHFDAAGREAGPPELMAPGGRTRKVVVELPPGAAWVAETYPADEVVEHRGGAQTVTLRVGEPAWLERLLLRVGPGATVTEPAEWRDLGREAARRVLLRYRDGRG